MGALTVRLTENMQAYVQTEAAHAGYPDGEAFLQSLIMDHHARKVAALEATIAEGEASGYLDGDASEIIDQALAEARDEYRSRTAS